MNQAKWIRPAIMLWLVGMLVLAGCGTTADVPPNEREATPTRTEATPENTEVIPENSEATPAANEEEPDEVVANNMDNWLEQVRAGDIESYNVAAADGAEQSFRWGLGYLTYYGSMENVGLDNLIYNALRAHIRLATGETTLDNLPRNQNNLMQITDGIQLESNSQPENQIGQTPELRQAILGRVVVDQSLLSPDEALASGEIIGVIAIPSPEDIGAKYLVYGQATPGEKFVFLGVVMVVDAIAREGASTAKYTHGLWDDLPWLGDAAGPFWLLVPPGGTGDPAKTTEGRPGVLFVHEGQYQAVK